MNLDIPMNAWEQAAKATAVAVHAFGEKDSAVRHAFGQGPEALIHSGTHVVMPTSGLSKCSAQQLLANEDGGER